MRDLVDGVDVEHALGSRLIALMHAVDPQVTGLALRIRLPSLTGGHRRGLGFDVMQQRIENWDADLTFLTASAAAQESRNRSTNNDSCG